MYCPHCKVFSSNNGLYCGHCGNKLFIKPVTKAHIIIIIICALFLILSLCNALFRPLWKIPIYASATESLRPILTEAENELDIIKNEYNDNYHYLTAQERSYMRKFLHYAEKSMETPSLTNLLDFLKEFEDDIENADDAIHNLKKALIRVYAFFIIACASLISTAMAVKRKNRLTLINLLTPLLYCGLYGSVLIPLTIILIYVKLIYPEFLAKIKKKITNI